MGMARGAEEFLLQYVVPSGGCSPSNVVSKSEDIKIERLFEGRIRVTDVSSSADLPGAISEGDWIYMFGPKQRVANGVFKVAETGDDYIELYCYAKSEEEGREITIVRSPEVIDDPMLEAGDVVINVVNLDSADNSNWRPKAAGVNEDGELVSFIEAMSGDHRLLVTVMKQGHYFQDSPAGKL